MLGWDPSLCRHVFNISRVFKGKSVHYDGFSPYSKYFSVEVLPTYQARIYI